MNEQGFNQRKSNARERWNSLLDIKPGYEAWVHNLFFLSIFILNMKYIIWLQPHKFNYPTFLDKLFSWLRTGTEECPTVGSKRRLVVFCGQFVHRPLEKREQSRNFMRRVMRLKSERAWNRVLRSWHGTTFASWILRLRRITKRLDQ